MGPPPQGRQSIEAGYQLDQLYYPSLSLDPYVEGYWVRSGFYDPPRRVRVLADACTKLIFELAPMPWGSAYVLGTQVSPIIVTLSGRVDRIGIRFKPGAASFFLRQPLNGLSGRVTPLSDLGVAEGEAMLARLRSEAAAEERATMLDEWLLARLPAAEADQRDLEEVMKVAQMLRAGLPPPDVARAMEWPERKMQRVCLRRFGASAANLHRLYRFDLLQNRLCGKPVELARLAADLGFSDQAHMSRDFRHFAQTTISAFLRERAAVGNVQDAGDWLPVLRDLQEEI